MQAGQGTRCALRIPNIKQTANQARDGALRRLGLMRLNGCHCFTLIELVVVISIIMVLMALLLPSLRSAMETVRRIQCSTQTRQLAICFSCYAADNNYYPPTPVIDAVWVEGSGSYWFSGFWLDALAKQYNVKKPYYSSKTSGTAFQCPSDKRFFNSNYRTSYGGNILGVAGYYNNTNLVENPSSIIKTINIQRPSISCWVAETFGNPAVHIPLGEGYIYDAISGQSAGGWLGGPTAFRHNGKTNFSFFDGHVEARPPEQVPTKQCYGSVWLGTLENTWFVKSNISASSFKGM